MEYEEKDGLWFGVTEETEKAKIAQPLTKYGNLALKYWESEKELELQHLIIEGKLNETMLQIQNQAEEMMEQLQEKMLKEDPIRNPQDTMETYRHRQRIHDQAEEIVLREIVYN
ncbi:TnpV protein [Anaerocolumna cellulosilytica]|uniref:TnpV protein n=1 Tax=Anaerocolumna cellulosilytica TaxID=433286 RepID=UPI0038CBFF2E